jgi:solute carrier family 25 phosphate transporter 23/24/25/41
VPYAGVELAVYCSLRDHFSALPLAALWCGAISSLCAQTVTYPIQLVRTRLQAHSGAMSARQCALQVMHSEGIRGLYRGWRANMTKSIPAVSIGYLVYEHTLQVLNTR